MKLPFRGRPLGDDEYDYEDEDFDPSPRPVDRQRVLGSPVRPEITADVPVVRPGPGVGVPLPQRPRHDVPPPAARSDRPRVERPLTERPLTERPLTERPLAEPPAHRRAGVGSDLEFHPRDDESYYDEQGEVAVLTEDDLDGEVSADDFVRELSRANRIDVGAEQRSAWVYLGVLSMLFVLIVGFGYGCSGRIGSDDEPMQPAEMLSSAQPARLVIKVEGDTISLDGSVPDAPAFEQLQALTAEVYGAENVVNNLIIDSGTSFDDGSLRMVGQSKVGDERPSALRSRIMDTFGLTDRGYDVGEVETVLKPVLAVVSINGSAVSLTGTLPDAQSITDLATISGEVWGPTNIDASGLEVGESTWTGGTIQLAGSAVSTDPRVSSFTSLVADRIGTLVAVETSGLAPGDAAAAVSTARTTIDTLLAGGQIQFGPDSAEIDPTSDPLLIQLAAVLQQVPATPVEVVGHTDSDGDPDQNQLLSEDRAAAVVERLVSLGVPADRLSSRGEGASNPVQDNSTPEGKAANRRIDFLLVGVGNG